MLRYPRIAVLLVLLATLLMLGQALAKDLPELASKAGSSVVVLTVHGSLGRKEALGSGFFVSPDGWIVTNHHVVEGASRVTAKLADGGVRDVTGIYLDDAKHDIAILQVEHGSSDTPALELGSSHGLKPGDEIAVIGSPHGLSGTLSTGIISALRDRGPDLDPVDPKAVQSWGLQITAAISPGSSGSPVLDRSGQVVGVAVGQLAVGQSLNFAIPVDVVTAMLQRLGKNPTLQPWGVGQRSEVARNLIISAAVFGAIALAIAVWMRIDARRKVRPRSDPRSLRS